MTVRHLEQWATSLMAGDPNISTLDEPPRYSEFSDWPGYCAPNTDGSPLLQRRAKALRDQHHPQPQQLQIVMPDYPRPLNEQNQAPPPAVLNLVDGQGGTDMSIEDFCKKYDLTDAIKALLVKNGYAKTRAMRRIKLPELGQMGFAHGEVASFQDAVEDWLADTAV
ncbi:hypothetical protein BD626DRAFT_256521 [Schizophyllum amplum]|uniref:Uncharacterized protein n=1 Tax=Schizophyllum amplum TaxID=97359 RepID=A0A550BUU0_9AGAR|nr:hypothetical protein BD626DRAFT_256521 [Auriculariopsis ampla]